MKGGFQDYQNWIKKMFNLFTPYYNDNAHFRQQELDWALKHNCYNPIFENIFLFPESRKNKIPKLTEKVHIIHLERRVTFQDIVEVINSKIDSYKYYNVIANSDIYFDDTLNLVRQINMDEICLALTRWESHPLEEKKSEPYMYMTGESQDVWIFKSFISLNISCNFYLGLLGCDGRFNFEVREAGYKVYNPSKDIRVLHCHVSGKRNHSEDTRLQGNTISPLIISIKDMENGKP